MHGGQSDLRVTYVYDLPLPSQLAAPIQILRTCRALCDHGARVRVLTGPLAVPIEECLAFYAIEPHERFELVPIRLSRLAVLRRRALEAALAPGAAQGPHAVVSRGKPAGILFRDLRRLRAAPRRLHVYEAHRPCLASVSRVDWHRRPRAALRAARTCRLERDAVGWVDGLVCLTDGVRDAFDSLYGVSCPVLDLPSGTDVPAYPPPGDERRDLDLVYAGKLSARKGVESLIEAMRFLPGRRAHIVGGTPEQVAELETVALELGVDDRVELTGFVPPRQVPDLLRRARVAVSPLPSDDPIAARFTSPLKVLEAMANGAPLVVSDLPTTRAVVDDGRTGLLVEPDSAEALARGVRSLLDDRPLAIALARNAFAEVQAYAWERRAERLLRFLESLSAGVATTGAERA